MTLRLVATPGLLDPDHQLLDVVNTSSHLDRTRQQRQAGLLGQLQPATGVDPRSQFPDPDAADVTRQGRLDKITHETLQVLHVTGPRPQPLGKTVRPEVQQRAAVKQQPLIDRPVDQPVRFLPLVLTLDRLDPTPAHRQPDRVEDSSRQVVPGRRSRSRESATQRGGEPLGSTTTDRQPLGNVGTGQHLGRVVSMNQGRLRQTTRLVRIRLGGRGPSKDVVRLATGFVETRRHRHPRNLPRRLLVP